MTDPEPLLELQRESFARAAPALLGSWPLERALGAEALAALIDENDFCVLATVTPRGRPQARPVRYAVAGTSFWIASVEGARLRNLRASPWASLLVSVGSGGDHRALLAEGPVVLHHEPAPELVRRFGARPRWAAAFVELRPERVLSYGRP